MADQRFLGTCGAGSAFAPAYDKGLATSLLEPDVTVRACLLTAIFLGALVCDAQAQQQCLVTGPTCTEAKAQCRQIRKRAFPGKSNNPCANRFRRCMAEGRYISRNCNVPMQKS
jgi:hypothetical protein